MPGVTAAAPTLATRWSHHLDDFPIAVICSRRGALLAAALSSGPIVVLELQTGAVVARLAGHKGGTLSLSWSADEAYLASGGQDGAVRIWDVARQAQHAECDGGAPWVEHVAFDPRSSGPPLVQVLASAAGRVLRLWSQDGDLVRAYAPHPSTISAISWQTSTQELVTAAYGAVTVLSPARERPIRRFRWKGSILAIACSRDGRYIATGDQDRTVHFWRTKTGDDLQMAGYPAKVLQLAWDAASRFLATGGSDVITIWDCKRSPEGTTPRACEGHDDLITGLHYQHHGHLLVSSDGAGTLHVWAPTRSLFPIASSKLNAEIASVAWTPEDTGIVAAAADGTVVMYDYRS